MSKQSCWNIQLSRKKNTHKTNIYCITVHKNNPLHKLMMTETHTHTHTHTHTRRRGRTGWLTVHVFSQTKSLLQKNVHGALQEEITPYGRIVMGSLMPQQHNNNNRIQRRYSRFFTISSQRRTLSPNTHTQVTQAQSCANRVQHIERLSRATCRVTCHLVRRDSSATKFDRVEIAFIWVLFCWLKPLNRWRFTSVSQGCIYPDNSITTTLK